MKGYFAKITGNKLEKCPQGSYSVMLLKFHDFPQPSLAYLKVLLQSKNQLSFFFTF